VFETVPLGMHAINHNVESAILKRNGQVNLIRTSEAKGTIDLDSHGTLARHGFQSLHSTKFDERGNN
jgi:hypothetical protein